MLLIVLLDGCSAGESSDKPVGRERYLSGEEVVAQRTIPLTDCALLVRAFEKNIFKRNGVGVQLSKETFRVKAGITVANVKCDNRDGFCVGRSCNQVAMNQGVGFSQNLLVPGNMKEILNMEA